MSGTRPTGISGRPTGGRGDGGSRGTRGGSTGVGGARPPVRRPSTAPRSIQARRTALVVVIALVLTVFSGRLFYLQGLRGDAIAAQALESRLTTRTLVADRGQITDAKGDVLATSVERYDIWVNQKELADWTKRDDSSVSGPAGAATLLAPILEMNAAELGASLAGDKGFKYVAKGVLPEVWALVRDLGIAGIGADQVQERVYPNGNLAGNVLGWVNADGEGAQGLEKSLDEQLSGTPGSTTYERGRGGQQIPGGLYEDEPATPGSSAQLTILSDLQWKAQEALAAQVQKMGATSGSLVAIDIPTGEILALAESSTVDPNDPGATPDLLGGSSAVSNVFDPGSTAKVVTMSAALETGLVTPLSQFEVPYQYTTPNGQMFKDSHEHAGLRLTTTGILAESSNTGTVMIGQNIPQQVRHDYLSKYGFGQRTGIELPNESAGQLWPSDDWDGRTKYAVLFGQGVAVTTLQAVEVFATVANHGVRVQPHLVKGWTAPDGTFTPAAAATSTQVVSQATADTVLTMLESAVDEGTGSAAAIPGYRVAGKTGTAQKFNPDGITASFIGVAPADNPRIAVAVVLHDPSASEWGGTVAAPVFSDVAGYALTELGVAPTGAPAQLFATTW